jgi:exonuclease SbcC
VEHPSPAADNSELTDKSAVDKARAVAETARRVMDNSREGLDTAASALTQTRAERERLAILLGPWASEPLAVLQAKHSANVEALNTLLAKQDLQRQLQARVAVIKAEQVLLTKTLETLAGEVSEHNEKVVRIRAGVDQLLSVLSQVLHKPDAITEQLAEVALHMRRLSQTLEVAEKAQADTRSECDKAAAQHAALEKQLIEQAKQTSEATAAWHEALADSLFVTVDDFRLAVLAENEQLELKLTIEGYRTELSAIKGAVQQIQADIAERTRPDLIAIEAALNEKNELYKSADTLWRTLEARSNQLKDIQVKLERAHEKNELLEAEYKITGTLSDVANGQTGNKISLQRFVLSVLLDDVLIQASQRLNLMSKGRYQLVRKEDRAKGNKASGLELEVEDSYSGKTRSVATLSGGESFLAALSLALGLSDVVQSYAGGIKLDALFIDEGFGSLDPESLDLAVRTLIDLQASGRMIGIISHVTELKEQMALRVDVESGRVGSHITINVAA